MSTQHFAESDERRQHHRLSRDEQLFLQVSRCDDDEELVGTTVLCSTIDASANGVKLHTRKEITQGIELDLWINIDGRGERFFLSGVVQWSRPEAEDYITGIELLDNSNTDIHAWQDLFI